MRLCFAALTLVGCSFQIGVTGETVHDAARDVAPGSDAPGSDAPAPMRPVSTRA